MVRLGEADAGEDLPGESGARGGSQKYTGSRSAGISLVATALGAV